MGSTDRQLDAVNSRHAGRARLQLLFARTYFQDGVQEGDEYFFRVAGSECRHAANNYRAAGDPDLAEWAEKCAEVAEEATP